MKEENKEKYFYSFFFSRLPNFREMFFLKNQLKLKLLFIEEVRVTHFYHLCISLPSGVSSSPISFSCSSQKASCVDRHLAWGQLTLASPPLPSQSCLIPGLPMAVAGGRRAQEGSRAPRSSPPPGTASRGPRRPGRGQKRGLLPGPLSATSAQVCTHLGSNTPVFWGDGTEVRNRSELWDGEQKTKCFSKAGKLVCINPQLPATNLLCISTGPIICFVLARVRSHLPNRASVFQTYVLQALWFVLLCGQQAGKKNPTVTCFSLLPPSLAA